MLRIVSNLTLIALVLLALATPARAQLFYFTAAALATEKKGIICSAFVADPGNAPPTSMADLVVVSKTKQRGD